ncbi:hypothetical protein NBE98_15630 [Clostridium swellfunianum]|uniref:hypothetical protein n=1 Tax=Clostridium swellfunianum TaxID=1367462 RepID=UPI00202F8237|nr:hypothetical protein [Clostridium swellfunianum]MCM0649797.1 hypothetical protein [Clostridium swellfunianum]
MRKKIGSIIIIVFTLIYVSVMIYVSGYDLVEIGRVKARQVINSAKNSKIALILENNKKPKVIYEDVKQNSEIAVNNNTNKNNVKKSEGKLYPLTVMKVSDKAKESKLEKIYLEEREIRQSANDQTPIDLNSIAKAPKSKSETKSNSENKNNEDVSVFKVMTQYQLTAEDKERIRTLSKKLSPLDQEKINTYLQFINDVNAKNAVNLLRDRLSDKEFEKIKDISIKLNK